MNKKTQMWIGVAALAGAAALLYTKNKNFANASGTSRAPYDRKNCKVFQGNIGNNWIGREIDGYIVTETGNGTTKLCKKSTGIIGGLAKMLGPKCKTYIGNANPSFVGLCVDAGEITSTGNGTTVVCRSNKCR